MSNVSLYPIAAAHLLRQKKYTQAAQVLKKSFDEHSNFYAYHLIATLYLDNKIATRKLTLRTNNNHVDTAIHLLVKCAKADLVLSQRLLGDVYSSHQYGKYCLELALHWYKKAAMQDDQESARKAFAICASPKNGNRLAKIILKNSCKRIKLFDK